MKRFRFSSKGGVRYMEAESLADIIGDDAGRLDTATDEERQSILSEPQLSPFFHNAIGRKIQDVPFNGPGSR